MLVDVEDLNLSRPICYARPHESGVIAQGQAAVEWRILRGVELLNLPPVTPATAKRIHAAGGANQGRIIIHGQA